MIAFQKYCQVHQTKMFFLTSFLGLMTFLMFIMSMLNIIKNGVGEAIAEPLIMAGFVDFPASFLLILLLHKLFNLYIKGHFFSRHTLNVLQTTAKLAILLGLVIKPAIAVTLMHFSPEYSPSTIDYFAHINLPVTVVGYILHIGTAAHKISRELEQEHELTV